MTECQWREGKFDKQTNLQQAPNSSNTAMVRDAIPDQFCSFFKQRSEKLVADGIPYHDNDDGSDVVLGSRKMALIMIMTVR